jgi:hypothetical protein
MSVESKTEPLSGIRVGISGAVPGANERQTHRYCESSIHDFIARLVFRIFEAGGSIVYGSHPTFTDVIDGVASRFFSPNRQPDRISMYVGRRFFHSQPESTDPEEKHPLLASEVYEKMHQPFATIKWIGKPNDSREDTLKELRKDFVAEAQALICIGGKSQRPGKGPPGIHDEAWEAVKGQKPVFLIARYGGYTRTLYEEWKRKNMLSTNLNNGLTEQENATLAEQIQEVRLELTSNSNQSSDPAWITTSDVLDLILKGLIRLKKR